MFITGYKDLALKIPDCHSGDSFWAASFKFNPENLSVLFPYINAVSEDAKYFENPHYIQFMFKGKRCALYEDKAITAPFEDKESVIEYIDILIGFLNELYEKKETITPDSTKFRHISVLDIVKLLPRTNCGKCGLSTCMAFAASLSRGEVPLSKCSDSGSLPEENAEQLMSVLDI